MGRGAQRPDGTRPRRAHLRRDAAAGVRLVGTRPPFAEPTPQLGKTSELSHGRRSRPRGTICYGLQPVLALSGRLREIARTLRTVARGPSAAAGIVRPVARTMRHMAGSVRPIAQTMRHIAGSGRPVAQTMRHIAGSVQPVAGTAGCTAATARVVIFPRAFSREEPLIT